MQMTRKIAAVRDSGERSPLLNGKQPETYVSIADSCKEFAPGKEPKLTEELQTLLSLVYPVVLTTGLEFVPGFTCIILAGHIDSPHTQQYVDAATLSTMFMNITAFSKVAASVSGMAYYACGIPMAALFGFHFALGVEGLWLGFGFGVSVSVALLVWMLLGNWSWDELAKEAQTRTAR
ncbi:uncharacterized protein KRP23_154 [Phytophthora ramorum]|uniref:uncharacterized protein n=1 Tax=Phytophthora ramorum TaxID=164328 RepID=UPI00309DA7EF|nr:hypothetical protein KRP23_154 [Phytophthora ramorum]